MLSDRDAIVYLALLRNALVEGRAKQIEVKQIAYAERPNHPGVLSILDDLARLDDERYEAQLRAIDDGSALLIRTALTAFSN